MFSGWGGLLTEKGDFLEKKKLRAPGESLEKQTTKGNLGMPTRLVSQCSACTLFFFFFSLSLSLSFCLCLFLFFSLSLSHSPSLSSLLLFPSLPSLTLTLPPLCPSKEPLPFPLPVALSLPSPLFSPSLSLSFFGLL